MHRLICGFSLCLAICPLWVMAQNSTNEFSFCPAGVRGDGVLDWTSLPAAPTPAAPVSASIPVAGVSGLQATVDIPNQQLNPLLPLYTANGAQLNLNTNGVVTVTFSQPVQ